MITQTFKQEYKYLRENKYLPGPRVLQIEITNKCCLNCPQCYKPPVKLLKNMTLDDFKKHVDMAADIGVKEISLLGGEPFENSDILNMIEYGVNKNIEIMTVTNGCHVSDEILERLKRINKGFTLLLSLNGSTEAINKSSRDGYKASINAAKKLRNAKVNFGINWVARADNVYDFPNLVELALKKKASWINVISNKIVNSKLVSPLGIKEYSYLSKCITTYRSQIDINIETCFSLLLVFMDANRGETAKGCFAGRGVCFVDAEGNYMPCSHLYYPEKRKSLLDYWNYSKTLASLRENRKQNFCNDCSFESKCRFCHAVSKETHDNLCFGYNNCPVKKLINQK